MSRTYSLSYLTTLDRPPPEAIRTAAAAGYDAIGLRLFPAMPGGAAHPLMDDPAALAATLAALQDTGVRVFDLEIIRLTPAFDVTAYLPFLETGARLGARAILVVGDDEDEARTAASLAALCEAAAPFNLSADLEFMPQSKLPDVQSALRVLHQAAQPNAGIIVDALHYARSGSTLADIDAIPAAWMHYLQICDAPAEIPDTIEGLHYTARCARLLPGEGGIDLAALFDRLPNNLPVSVEVPNDKRAPALGPLEWARQALAASRAILEPVTP